ncbi:uncharacterized protein LOC110881983 [Helianthus annuus]|uniref:uncharacterized protein LOC110881983 n=1 Tax=Helianthus annuus TaxID=4232 RepID=UPI000B8F34B4|nr:uncharacterized protein LOC110881983 [Helianthus annuus]
MAWNIRGLNRPLKQSEVRVLVAENNLKVCAILESHVEVTKLVKVCKNVFRKWNWTSNGGQCSRGTRIILGWDTDSVDLMVLAQSDQVIHVQLIFKADKKVLFGSFVYAENKYQERRALWDDLCKHNSLCYNKPWFVMGDFNTTLYHEDSLYGPSKHTISMREFNECIQKLELFDIKGHGLHYTWTQKPKNGVGLLKKIDRVMGNFKFLEIFPDAYAMYQPYRVSDHSPCILKTNISVANRAKPFKFPNFITAKPEFRKYVVQEWSKSIDGVHMFSVMKKLRSLKPNARCKIHSIVDASGNRHDGDGVVDALVTREEIKQAMFSISENKAPGPDGYTSAFFKHAWDIVGEEVTNAVLDFFDNGQLLKQINHAILSLIPKKDTADSVLDYRPISCCNVLYKCISKIITERIKGSLESFVGINQSAFVPGRKISDNILLTQELMHNYHLNRGPPRCAFKIDIQKAYDTVNWSFLEVVLQRFGFHNKMVKWIMTCVTTASYSVSINGDIHGYFPGKRGLRQGDPMSPYLFTLIMEVLSLLLQKAAESSFKYHAHCAKQKIINVSFADDLFIFVNGDISLVKKVKNALELFTSISGLVPSPSKSTVFLCNVPPSVRQQILSVMPFQQGVLPIR